MLGVKGDQVTHTSDYFDELQRLCIRMIEEGNAYADDTEQEKVRSSSSLPTIVSYRLATLAEIRDVMHRCETNE